MLRFLIAKGLKKMRGAAIRRSVIHATSKVESGSQVYDSTMDKYSFCGYDCEISFTKIGAFCSIANGVLIGGGRHPIEWASTSPVFYDNRDSIKKKYARHVRPKNGMVVVVNDVWIGANAIIMQGVNIGTGAVVGAGSVVTRDVPHYAIVAGVPARQIRMRFDKDLVDRFLKSKWWELDDDQLAALADLVPYPEKFLRALGR